MFGLPLLTPAQPYLTFSEVRGLRWRRSIGGVAEAAFALSSTGRALADLSRLSDGDHKLRLVYINGLHSAFESIPGYWPPRRGAIRFLLSSR